MGRLMRKRRVVAGKRLGGLEAEVMEFIWSQEGPVTVNAILPVLKGRTRAYTTIMTIVTRLHEKGLIERARQGRSFVYWPAGSRDELAARALHELISSAEHPEAVLAHFVEDLRASPDLLRRLRKLVEEGRKR